MPEFIHLHNHTHYSLLDGACSPDGLIQAAGEQGMSSVALTDHGVNFGLLEFYKKAKKAGIKPILGCEVYVADGSRSDRQGTNSAKGTRNYFHLVLLAKDLEGYRNLNRLTSRAHTEGFYYKPRIDRELLAQHSTGLVALSACAGGVVSAHLVGGNYDRARDAAIWYREQFGEDFFLEIQNHGIPVDAPVLEGMPRLAKELNIPLVATNDCHYIRKDHAIAHNVLLHIRDAGKGTRINVEEELRYGTDNYYFKSADEMAKLFKEYPEAIENTLAVAERCNLSIPSEFYMPKFPIPEESPSETLDEYLEELTWKGMEKRYSEVKIDLRPELRERTEFELDVIKRMGYSGYFLIVQDFINAARDMGISVGPGRGSAAGSLIAYALGITNIDPIQYDLLFERFLNPDRVSMPDIDVDFADDRREEVIDYVKQKYGDDAVAQIITFGTLSSRAVLKDVGRVLGVPLSTINSITEKIEVKFGKVAALKDAIETAELRWVKESDDPLIKKLIDYSLVLEGFCRNASLHAAGVVIAPGPLEDYIPLYKTPDSGLASQYTMKYLEEAGLLKMDFLGLRTLSIIDRTLELVKQRHNVDIDIDTIPLDDAKTYELVGQGLTTAVFQFESPPMQKYLKDLKPTVLEDLIAMNALYRPGPMDNIPDFIDRKWGRKEVEYLHSMLEPILGVSYGICVAGDTLVWDARNGRPVRIDAIDLNNGEFTVQGVDNALQPSTALVTHHVCNGVKPVVEVRLRNGARVKMTRDHKVLTEAGWREIGTLQSGDYIATPRVLDVQASAEVDERRLRVLAYLIADGSLTSGASCDFVTKDERLAVEYERCLSAFDNLRSWRLTQVRDVQRIMVASQQREHYHQPNSLLAWLRELGLKASRGGCSSHNKFIPEFVFGLPEEQIAFFLASLWDCDGCIAPRLCHYKTVSHRLAEDVRILLLRLGIHGTIHTSRYRNSNDEEIEAYQVTVYDLSAFAEKIGPHLVAKTITPTTEPSGSPHDSLHREAVLAEVSRHWRGSARGLMERYGFDRQHLAPVGRSRPRIATAVVEPLAHALGMQETLRSARVRWEEIVAIEEAGKEAVYDITVEGIHNFVGNGVILHNCVYQEQIMQIAQQLGGFTLAQADTLRRAMGKKDMKLMDEMKASWDGGCKGKGIDKRDADAIWDMMVKFANYGFNKSHSAAYAYIAYQTAWLKANYTAEFMAANMTCEAHTLEKVVKLIDECRKFDIRVLPPDVNESALDFTVTDKGAIRFGMAAIRNVGASAVTEILRNREKDGPFTSLFDFARRMAGRPLVNKRLIESLVQSGAFDSLHPNRRAPFEAIESAMSYAQACAASEASGMTSLFALDDEGNGGGSIPEPEMPRTEDWDKQERLRREKEMLNFYVSGHPLEEYEIEAESFASLKLGEVEETTDLTKPIRVCGIVSAIRTKLDRRENQIAFVTIEDFTGKAECVFWSDAWRRFAGTVAVGDMIVAIGRGELRGADGLQVVVDDIIPLAQARGKFAKAVVVTVQLDTVAPDAAQRTLDLFKENKGEMQCIFRIYDNRALSQRMVSRKFLVAPSTTLLNGLRDIYGRRNVGFVAG